MTDWTQKKSNETKVTFITIFVTLFYYFYIFFAILGYSRILRDPSGIFQDSSSADHP